MLVAIVGVSSCLGDIGRNESGRAPMLSQRIEVAVSLLGAEYPDPVVPAPTSYVGGQSNGLAAGLIDDLATWDRADHDGRVGTAESISIKYRDFVFGQMEKVTRGGATRDVAVFLYHGHPEEQYVLVPGWVQGGAARTTRVSPFLMARQVVSEGEWTDVMAPGAAPGGRLEQPAAGVAWIDAARFCMRRHLELPTEAEWEHACRAGERVREMPTDAAARAWTPAHDLAWARPVVATNGLGLADMPGRLWELTEEADGRPGLAPPTVVARGGVASTDGGAPPIGNRMLLPANEAVVDVAVRPIFRLRGPWPFPQRSR